MRTSKRGAAAPVLVNRRVKGVNRVYLYSQVVLPLERLATHRAHVFPLVAVRQLVLRERRCVVEHLPADLQTETVQRVSASLCKCFDPDRQLNWLFRISGLLGFSLEVKLQWGGTGVFNVRGTISALRLLPWRKNLENVYLLRIILEEIF